MSRSIKKHSKRSESYSGQMNRVSRRLTKKFTIRKYRTKINQIKKNVGLNIDIDSCTVFHIPKPTLYSYYRVLLSNNDIEYKKYLRK